MPTLVSHPDEVKVISRRFGQGAANIDKYLELDGYKAVHHSGGWSGYVTDILRVPSRRITAIVLSNSSSDKVLDITQEMVEIATNNVQK